MPKAYITLGICALAILVTGICVLFMRHKINQISELPEEVISNVEKEKVTTTLTQRLYIILGILIVAVINIFLPDGLLKFLIPLITMMSLGLLMSTTMEEVAAFDIQKDDVDTFLEERERRKKDMKRQREMMEEANRKKREAKERAEELEKARKEKE